jgi:GntR family transcriptional regulator
MLNPHAPIPLYRQLAEILQERIEDGTYLPQSRIPSEPELAKRFGIGRPTVRQAVEVLVRQGLVVRRRGAGTFVRQQRPTVNLFSMAGTSAAFAQSGIDVSTRLLGDPRLQSIDPNDDHPFAGRSCCYLKRISQLGEAPLLLEEIFLDSNFFRGICELNLAGTSLARLVERHYFVRPSGGRQSFQVRRPPTDLARHLKVAETTPVLTVRRCLDFGEVRNAVYALLYCRTEQFEFSQSFGDACHD